MMQREQSQRRQTPDQGGGAPDGRLLMRARDGIGDLISAGDDIIDAALSGDHEQFLKANRQKGGQ